MRIYVIGLVAMTIIACKAAAPAFDPATAYEIYGYAQPAYCNNTKLPEWVCDPCKRHPNMQEIQVFFNNTHDAQGYCGYDPDANRVVLAIRGTVDNTNWKADFNFPLIPYACDGCKVHQGFHNIWEDLANNLFACAYTLHSNHPSAEVIVTGHSLGAAQSTFAAVEINKYITRVDKFYNFGCPRVGNAAYATYVEQQLSHLFPARIVHWQMIDLQRNRKDMFTHMPTQDMGFQHYGHEIFFNEDNSQYSVCGREDKSCQDQFFFPWQWNLPDHLHYYGECAGCYEVACNKK